MVKCNIKRCVVKLCLEREPHKLTSYCNGEIYQCNEHPRAKCVQIKKDDKNDTKN
jgi:hypothetical protein